MPPDNPNLTYIFAGGGTGGHLYPGLAIAAELRRTLAPSGRPVRCVFVCSDRPLDAEILTKAGVEFRASHARPLASSPRGLMRFAMSWGGSVKAGRKLIRELRRGGGRTDDEPSRVCVVAMGGFVAAPIAQASRLERVPLTLVNLDAVPGKANRWIAGYAGRVFTAIRVRDGGATLEGGYAARWKLVPPIIRAEADAGAGGVPSGGARAAECRRKLGLDPQAPTLMITGGSQGAKSLNDFVTAFASSDIGQHALKIDPQSHAQKPWQILHQTGKDADGAAADAYKRAGITAVVRAFTDQMADWWGASDLAIARAGAGNVAEVWANKTPTLFLPYPHHKDEHQRFNAMALEEAGGARIARDLIDPARNLDSVAPVLRSLIENPAQRRHMRLALEKLGPADGAARIADALLETLSPAEGVAAR
jgi:UDP-N-acetylglucosamine--N-acetylmuramyl-(pentapeptide) pyrophosphoryl-undecaprenol N-acetylglucosamine transferase